MTALPIGAMRPDSIVSVEFAGIAIPVVMHEGQPFVAIRPICDALKLMGGSQYNRIKRNEVLRTSVVMMKTEIGDQTYTLVYLPLGSDRPAKQHAHAAAAPMPRTQPNRECLAVQALERDRQPHLQIIRRQRRSLLPHLEQTCRSASAHHLPQTAPMDP
ncbi:MAG: Uncharacterized protein FD149_881 [Rhodospirillaceae bacterium]|nr:MAG: Uncharacterized protein FD149_881 [Rhodospirillaceae bacterium]